MTKPTKNTCFLIFVFFLLIKCTVPQSESNFRIKENNVISKDISNQTVSSILEDSLGYIWIGTERGLNRYNSYEYFQYFHTPGDSNTLCNNNVNTLSLGSDNKIWIGTDDGICFYDITTDRFRTVSIHGDQKSVEEIRVSSEGKIFANLHDGVYLYDAEENSFKLILQFEIYTPYNTFIVDQENKLWLINKSSINCYDSKTFKLLKSFPTGRVPNLYLADLMPGGLLYTRHGKGNLGLWDIKTMSKLEIPFKIKSHPALSKALIMNVFPFENNKLLINTHKNGLFLYDEQSDELIHEMDQEFPFLYPDCEITGFYSDRNANLWIGTHENGIIPIYQRKNQFNSNNYLSSITRSKSAKSIAKGDDNNLWISTYNDELIIYNLDTKNSNFVDLSHFFTDDPFYQDKVNAILIAHSKIWLLTTGKVVRCAYNNHKLTIEKTYNTNEVITHFVMDDLGTIWIATQREYLFYITQDAETYKKLNIFADNQIYNSALIKLSNGKILAAATNQPLKLINPETLEIQPLTPNTDGKTINVNPTVLFEEDDKDIWIGNLDGSLLQYSPSTNKMQSHPAITNVVSVLQADNGVLWMGTLWGLYAYDKQSKEIHNYFGYDGIGGNQFNTQSACKLTSGELAFGGTHGLTCFFPNRISLDHNIPLHFEELKVNDSSVAPNHGIINQSLQFNPEIKLKYNQNVISISYAALDYSEHSRLRYYYKLEGYENQWVDAKNNRTAFYSNLSPGSYTFKIRVNGNDNTVMESSNELQIHISRPPWLSIGAFIGYCFIVLLVAYYIYKQNERIRINKTNALIATKEKEHEAFINKMNMSFFSNISHEFRTPLTIIKAPINLLSKSSSLQPEEKSMVELVQRSIKRMLRLVNQLMDLSKLEADALKLKVTRADLTYQVKSTIEIFELPAKEKHINLKYSGLTESFFMLLDIDKLEKILANLLSNALKFTPEQGEISVQTSIINAERAMLLFSNLDSAYENYYALIEVSDTGIGIPEDKLDSVFERYYQIDDEKNATINWGTGIGLYYTKRLLNLHHGEIKATNNAEGGCTFKFVIPTTRSAYIDSELLESTGIVTPEANPNSKLAKSFESEVELMNTDKETILVVDDDVEIAYFLKNLLRTDYNVQTKYDGQSALKSLDTISPSLIISDVLMPGMTGYELCNQIKTDINYSHIPVILLTAKTLLKEQVEGLEVGANAYITKPFEPEYIQAMVKSQLKNKKLLSQILKTQTDTSSADGEVLSLKDKAFLNQLYELLENELSNNEINISIIADKLKMSRTSFYNKIKAMTGEKPNAFFRQFKLNRAAEILLTGEHNISEIAYMTGFSTVAHFSTSFKKQFGCSPSEYKG